ncbi:MAG: hypothetical protein C5B51_20410 [Terriglobia bacterium]|nr:MAG: hypothetical protein C5B51_20410 [Terriglobia bacterium]
MEFPFTLGRAGWLLLAAAALSGQEPAPAVLENTGKPMTIPFQCTEEDMQWAGMSCTEDEPCPMYFELTAAQAIGDKIFAAGNLHSNTVTLYSILLGTEDTGKTWREVHARIRGAGLDHIQFADFVNGWVSGEALSPLPQDPFLLITTDGGKTWRQQAVFSENQPGSIQQFFFASRNAGNLIIDRGEGSEDERYALYESPNGGDTWIVKQLSNKPLRLPRPPEPEVNWRVQPDRQAFRIERRQAERWIPAASFAVSAGACKPLPLESRPPEEPAPAPPPPPPSRRPRR